MWEQRFGLTHSTLRIVPRPRLAHVAVALRAPNKWTRFLGATCGQHHSELNVVVFGPNVFTADDLQQREYHVFDYEKKRQPLPAPGHPRRDSS